MVSFPQISPQTAYIRLTSHHMLYMPHLFHSSRNVIAVTIQHWPHTIRCHCYCTQHSSMLSQSVAHSIHVTVDEQSNSQSESAIPDLSSSSVMFQLSSASVMSAVVFILFSSTSVLTANGSFSVVPLLHSVSDKITQCVAVRRVNTATFAFLSLHTRFHSCFSGCIS